MKNKIIGIALALITVSAIIGYPKLMAKTVTVLPPDGMVTSVEHSPVVDVVFVLDTTGSMSGLIQTAKEKIWSIATTMASAQPTPEIRIGLVAYRDRGDQYVTKLTNLSSDLDSIYATLMDFRADGGGDTPESVNQALHDAVNGMSWTEGRQAYKAIFLVGDAPPHRNYNEIQYPEILAAAKEMGIVVNTIQSGDMDATIEPWTQIAGLGSGHFFQVEQTGNGVAFTTPYDAKIADLSAKIDKTRLYFGSEDDKDKMAAKVRATDKLHASASVESRARRAAFNASAGGRTNLLGKNELVDAVASGDVEMTDMPENELPAVLKPMAPAEQKKYVVRLAEERSELQRQIVGLSTSRDEFLARKVEEAGGMADSLDMQIYEAVKEQAGNAGFEYESGPAL